MPAVSNQDDSGLVALKTLHNNIERLKDSADATDDDIDFLSNFLSDLCIQELIDVQDKLEEPPKLPSNPTAEKCKKVVIQAVINLTTSDKDAEELHNILSDVHVAALLSAHDEIINSNVADTPAVEDAPVEPYSPSSSTFISPCEKTRLVGITKSDTETLGITVKIDENDNLVIARILKGSMSDKLGLLHVSDIIKEVNNIPVFTPQQVMDIIRNSPRSITLTFIPAYREDQETSQLFVKAHFNYSPQNDHQIPSKDVGLTFKDGDILCILNHDDSKWWQAQIFGDESHRVGLIPSRTLEESRKAFIQADVNDTKSSLLCGLKRKKKKKIKYNSAESRNRDLVLYEEVTRVPPFKRKTLVLVGANGIGRRSLKERLIKSDPCRFASAIPYTSRAPREREVHGRKYYFSDRETMEMEIKNNIYLEYGELNGNLYGTKLETIQETIRSGKMCVLDINPTSLKALKNPEFMPYIIFIAAPSVEALMLMYEEGQRKGAGRGMASPGIIDFKTEEDFLKVIEESEQIEKVYESYFDLIIVNDGFDDTFHEIQKVVNSLSMDIQWVPVSSVH